MYLLVSKLVYSLLNTSNGKNLLIKQLLGAWALVNAVLRIPVMHGKEDCHMRPFM